MVSIPSRFAIAPEALDEVEKASIELTQYLETQAESIASRPPIDPPLHGGCACCRGEYPPCKLASQVAAPPMPKGFRKGYAEHAAEVSDSIKEFAATGVGAIWQIAERIAQMRSRLNRKEFRGFVSELLEWTGSEARKYLDIERAFRGFDFSRLANLEPFTLLRLRTKRYTPVVERLREEAIITSRSVQQIIKELLPRQTKKKQSGGVSLGGGSPGEGSPGEASPGDTPCDHSDAVLQRHPNTADGTFYYTLKNTNLSDKTGLWLEEQLETRTVGQVLEWAANRESEIEERDRRIAELEARLARVESAQTVERVEVAPQVTSQPEALQTWEEFAQSVQNDPSVLLDTVKTWTPERKQQLPSLLAAHLEDNPSELEKTAQWIPVKLLKAACANLSFAVRKIVGSNNLVDSPRRFRGGSFPREHSASVQWFYGYRFVSLEYLNTRNERWIFADKENNRCPVFGRDEFAIVQF